MTTVIGNKMKKKAMTGIPNPCHHSWFSVIPNANRSMGNPWEGEIWENWKGLKPRLAEIKIETVSV